MATSIDYVAGAERPALLIQLLDELGAVIDLTGYTCSLKIGDPTTTVLTKTTGMAGSANGVTATFSAGELALTPATYLGEVIATSGGLDYRRQFSITITPALP
tara:strand:- start:113 stop:421 length:309 start_codon:yes stop_codon:yes gene_type:complete